MMAFIIIHYSYLKSLVPTFNEYVGKLVEKLRPLADGRTQVPMKKELSMLIVSAVGKVMHMSILSRDIYKPC